ncbi:MAG: hypothetical protein PHY02_04000 [Phycisphaerae bacterium]|nr:hypothetical protein [Phycisphaerae bacterium]
MKWHITFPLFLCFLVTGSNFTWAKERYEGRPIAVNNEVVNDIVPMSKVPIPDEIKEVAEQKTERLLSFFKTPDQQLMPVGMYAMVEDMTNVEILRKFQASGINLVHRYASTQGTQHALTDLQAARSAGIGVLQNLPSAYLTDKDLSWWRDHIKSLVNDNQILAWYLPEERKAPDEVKRNSEIARIIQEVDIKKRPMFTYVEWPEKEYLKKSGEYVDALLFGAYPSYYSPRPRIDIRRRIDLAYSSGVPVIIGTVESVKDPEPGQRLPAMGATRPEYIRADAYIALIGGAKGLMWYCWAQARKVPGLMDSIYEVATELNGPQKIGEVLLSGLATEGIECKLISGDKYAPPASAYENKSTDTAFLYSSLQWTARRHEGYLYIFTVNVNEDVRAPNNGGQDYAVKVQFHIPYKTDGQVKVLFKDRNIKLDNDRFVDEFMPLEVNVYKIKLE